MIAASCSESTIADEVPNCHKVVMGAKVLETAEPLDVGDLILESARRALDEVVPALGARPRDLVKNAEGSLRPGASRDTG